MDFNRIRIIHGRLATDLKNHIDTSKTFTIESNKSIIKDRYKLMRETYANLTEVNLELELAIDANQDIVDQLFNNFRIIETEYINAKAHLLETSPALEELQWENMPSNSTMFPHRNSPPKFTMNNESNAVVHQNNAKLPALQLGKFSGKIEDWEEFEDIFSSIVISNQSIPDVQKMHYLKLSLSEEPANVIKHLPTTAQSFSSAWIALRDRYKNKRSIIEAHLKRFFSIKAIQNDNVKEIRDWINTTNNMISALQLQGMEVNTWDPIIVYVISQKMNSKIAQHWEDSLGDEREMPNREKLFKFLETQLIISQRTAERQINDHTKSIMTLTAHANQSSQAFSVNQQQQNQSNTNSVRKLYFDRSPYCVLCKTHDHTLKTCNSMNQLTMKQKEDLLTQRNICKNCLRQHKFEECPSTYVCRTCNAKHHSYLHTQSITAAQVSTLQNNSSTGNARENQSNKIDQPIHLKQETEPGKQTSSGNIQALNSQIPVHSYLLNITGGLLATAQVPIYINKGKKLTIRAILDQGSQANFISKRMQEQLEAQTEKVSIPIKGIGQTAEMVTESVEVKIGSIHNPRFEYKLNALVLPKLGSINPSHMKNFAKLPHLKGIKLADPNHMNEGDIDLLIGASSYGHLLLYGVKKYGKNTPILQETLLGWIMSGANKHTTANTLCLKTQFDEYASFDSELHKKGNPPSDIDRTISNDELNRAIKNFWEIEEIVPEKRFTEEEKLAEKHFLENTKQLEDGKLRVRLPFKNSPSSLGPSYALAYVRFKHLETKLIQDEELYKEYKNVINEYITLSHMREATSEELNNAEGYYVPHHAIIRRDKTTTKVRIVFDASAKTKSGQSLNNLMMVEPTIQKDLLSIFINWRKYKIALTADVEKMYRMIKLDDQDAKYQKILWRNNPDEPLKTYVVNTVMFGNAAAPFLAIRSLKYIADQIEDTIPNLSSIIKEQFYVDDFFGGAQTID